MEQETQKIIADQLSTLPESLKNAITAIDYPRKLEVITKSNKLMIDQAGKLEMETTLVMLGLEPLADYVGNLERELEIPKEKAITIANDANELIFKNIRAELQKINDDAAAAQAAETPAPKPASAPTRDEIISGIENPQKTTNNMLPEIAPVAPLPAKVVFAPAQTAYHENISPVADIVKTKMTEPVAMPKETIVVEEKTKLPEKSKPSSGGDPYRESII